MKNLLTVLMLLSVGCIANAQTEKENFDVFFQRFMTEEEFQLERVQFPLEFIEFDENYEEASKTIKKADWVHQWFYANEQAYPTISNGIEPEDTDERIFEWHGIENGIYAAYYFKRIEGKWYLTKWEDLST